MQTASFLLGRKLGIAGVGGGWELAMHERCFSRANVESERRAGFGVGVGGVGGWESWADRPSE